VSVLWSALMTTFDHRSGKHVEVDDARIYYEIVGDEGKPYLLLLHGGMGNLEDFNPIVGALSKDFRLLAIDSRGHGKSTLGSAELTYERLQKDIEHVLESLRIQKVGVIGFSDGGIVALRLAASAVVNIDKLVVIGADWHAKNLEPVKELLSSVTAESWRKKFPETYDAYQKLNPQPDFERLTRRIKPMWLDSSPSGYPNDTVRHIRCPLLVVRGDEDHLVSRQGAMELADRVENAKLLNFPFVGHVAFQDADGVFKIVLERFLGSA
jgi:pimeloyl-ACP methyl ester carboxylesterase